MWPRRRRPSELFGYLERRSGGGATGWVRDRHRPGVRLDVEIYAAGTLIGSTRADHFRADLERDGIGDGRHAFSLDIDEAIAPETLAAKVSGSDYWLLDGAGMSGGLVNGSRRGLPMLRPGMTTHAVSEADVAVAAELQRGWQAYAAACPAASPVSGGAMWTEAVAHRHRDLLEQLRGNDAAALARLMVDIHKSAASHGLVQGELNYRDFAAATPEGRRTAVLHFHDMLASLVQYLAIERAECADLDVAGSALACPSEELVRRVEAQLGHPIVPPAISDGLFGLAIGDGVLHGRDVQALYVARRAIEVTGPSPRLAEVGGGFGKVAYYAMLGGARGYTLVDLPTVSAMQFFALRRSLPDVPVRFGPEPAPGAINLVFATDEGVARSLAADLVINTDSFPEMGQAVCRAYFELLAANRASLLSINQEGGTAVGTADVQAVVGEILPDYGFRRRYRFRTWVRPGFVEELWTPADEAAAPA